MQEKIKTSNEATVQERPISDEDIQYLRELADKSFTANFSIVGFKGTDD